MDRSTHDVRRANWFHIITECQQKLANVSVKQWLADNGLLSGKLNAAQSVTLNTAVYGVSQANQADCFWLIRHAFCYQNTTMQNTWWCRVNRVHSR